MTFRQRAVEVLFGFLVLGTALALVALSCGAA